MAATHILGISAFYHESAACLVRDGEIVAAAQEERFSRKKRDASVPALAARLGHPRRPSAPVRTAEAVAGRNTINRSVSGCKPQARRREQSAEGRSSDPGTLATTPLREPAGRAPPTELAATRRRASARPDAPAGDRRGGTNPPPGTLPRRS